MATIFEKQTITFYPAEYGLCLGDLGTGTLIDGESYDVYFDGTKYTCTAELMTSGELSGISLGNKAILGIEEDSGEPFIVGNVGSALLCFSTDTEEAPHEMAICTKMLFAKQTVTGFAFFDGYGLYEAGISPPPFDFELGNKYKVFWDGNIYICEAQDLSAMMEGCIAIGNLSAFGGQGNDEPFIIAWSSVGVSFFSQEENESHEIGVYEYTETEEPEEPNGIIFEEQMLPFAPDEAFNGLCVADLGAIELIEGEQYDIVFDGVSYTCTAEHMVMGSLEGIGVGNKAIVMIGDDTGEPFIIGVVGVYALCLTAEFSETSHTVGIYTHDEPQGIILRNYHGENVVYEDIETITFGNTDGGMDTFTRGIALHDVPISPDFSSGDHAITIMDGYLAKSAIVKKPENLTPENIRIGQNVAGIDGSFIGEAEETEVDLNMANGDMVILSPGNKLFSSVTVKKPETLVPANIADGIDIAGILGTHKGGGGSTQKIISKSGTYTATGTGAMTVTHNLGVLPDVIIVRGSAMGTTYNIIFTACTSPELGGHNIGAFYQSTTSIPGFNLMNADIYATGSSIDGFVRQATPSTFQIGGTAFTHVSGSSYYWTVIGGIIERKVLNVQLSLDGEGNLIISGGVPEIEQFNIYVDGTLAKTVDYIHSDDDDFIVDISDVASEIQEYTISVDGVGSAIEEAYPMAFYEPVTGYTVPRAQGSCGDSVNYKLLGDGTLKIYGTGAMDDYSGASGQPWYSYASTITSVVVDDGVTRIGSQSLRQLTSMTKISIADSVTTYGTSAFLGSTALSSITISANVTTINAYAFNECTGLKTAYYEGTLEQWCKINFGGTGANPCFVGNATLYIGGETLVDAVIPESVTAINAHVFTNCKTLVSITMQEGIKSIGTRAFYGCSNLQGITIPNGVTSIGSYAFYNCAKLSNVTLPSGLTNVASYTFYGCTAITSITIPDSVTSIGDYAFSGSYITSIIIPDKVTQILWRAFQNCTKLTSVTIGSAVNLIGDNAFYGCSALTSATFKDTTTWVRNSSQTSTTGTTISSSYLSSTSTAATYLRSTYVGYWWHKN